MKTIILLIVSIIIPTSAFSNVYLGLCYENNRRNTGVSYSYQNCVKSNFDKISRELNTNLFYCSNLGPYVSYSYISCIKNNFTRIERELSPLYLRYCDNFNRDRLEMSYTNCVRSNFSKIQRKINTSSLGQ